MESSRQFWTITVEKEIHDVRKRLGRSQKDIRCFMSKGTTLATLGTASVNRVDNGWFYLLDHVGWQDDVVCFRASLVLLLYM